LTPPPLLLLTDWFAPGYRVGGPIRSTVNLAKALQNDLDIRILTSHKDHNSNTPYPNIEANTWLTYDKNIQVFYCSESHQNLKTVKKIIQDVQPDSIYLNSMFSPVFTITPLRLLLQKQISCPVILAPRGMLKESALQFKATKKKIFLNLIKGLGLHKKIHFHATTAEEAQYVKKIFGRNSRVTTLNNLPAAVDNYQIKEKTDPCKLIFVGRIHPIKGLDHLLSCLKTVTKPVSLSIVGHLEDEKYWDRCLKIIHSFPPHITVDYLGELPHHLLKTKLEEHHFLALPTQGENFGHAIFEALASGLPVIISDQTPWRELCPKKVGWDLSLNQPSAYSQALEAAAAMDQATYNQWSRSAWQFAKDYIDHSNIKQQYLELFSQKE